MTSKAIATVCPRGVVRDLLAIARVLYRAELAKLEEIGKHCAWRSTSRAASPTP